MKRLTGVASAFLSRRSAKCFSDCQLRMFSQADPLYERLTNFDEALANARRKINDQRQRINQFHGEILSRPFRGGQMVERTLAEQALMNMLSELATLEDQLDQVTAERNSLCTKLLSFCSD